MQSIRRMSVCILKTVCIAALFFEYNSKKLPGHSRPDTPCVARHATPKLDRQCLGWCSIAWFVGTRAISQAICSPSALVRFVGVLAICIDHCS